MNVKAFIALMCLTTLLVYQPLSASETCDEMTAEDISQFVASNFDDWQGRLAVGSLFSSGTVVKRIEFEKGFPLQIYTITAESLQNYATQGSFQSVLVAQNTWSVPLISNVGTYYFLDVYCSNGELDIVGSEQGRVAEQLHQIWSQLKEQANFIETQTLIVKMNAIKRVFLAVEKDAATTIYPLNAFPTQYASLKSVDDLGGYSASEVLLLIATEFLTTANVATVTPELKITIPKAVYMPATAIGTTSTLSISLEHVPNTEGKLLFEAIEHHFLP